MLEQVVDLVGPDAPLHDDRRQRVVAVCVQLREHLLHRGSRDGGERAELLPPRRPRLRKVGGPELDARPGDVADQHVPVAVDDRAAGRLEPDRAHAVVVRHRRGTGRRRGPAAPRAAGRARRRPPARGTRARRRGARVCGVSRYGSSTRGSPGRNRPPRGAGLLAKEAHLPHTVAELLRREEPPHQRVDRQREEQVEQQAERQGVRRRRRPGAGSPSTNCRNSWPSA